MRCLKAFKQLPTIPYEESVANKVISPALAEAVRSADYHGSQVIEQLRKGGWRTGQLLITVAKGKSHEVSDQLFNSHSCIQSISTRIDSNANVVADIYYRASTDLHSIIEEIRTVPNVSDVHFSEIIEILHSRPLLDVLQANT